MALDPYLVKQDFPLLARDVAYLDSAATAQKPKRVIEAMDDFYRHHYATVHRAVYELSVDATTRYEAARARVASFLNARPEEVIFTRSATGALNLVAGSYERGPGQALGPRDVIVTTELEHHSNYVPFQQLARRKQAQLGLIPVDEQGELQLDALDGLSKLGPVRLVSLSVVSNALGTINPVKEVVAWARAQGAIVVLDAAQAAPHLPLDVAALDCDFLALSAHKLGGPSGVGALYGRQQLLSEWPPYEYGGGMIARVGRDESSFAQVPYKFEAGTPPIAEAVGFAAALDYLDEVGLDAVSAHEKSLVEYALERLDQPTVSLYGPPPERRSGIVSFSVTGVHPHDVAQVLDSSGVAVRGGHHCAQPLMRRLGLAATTRASFWLYSTEEDVDRLADGVAAVRRTFA